MCKQIDQIDRRDLHMRCFFTNWLYHQIRADKQLSDPELIKAIQSALKSKKLLVVNAEDFRGLERAYIFVTGFHDPYYLRERLKGVLQFMKEHNGDLSKTKKRLGELVAEERDPALYIALTRATYAVVFVEPDVEHFARHYQLSNLQPGEAGSRDEVSTSHAQFETEDSAGVVWGANGEARLFLRRTLQLADAEGLPGPEELKQLTSVKVVFGESEEEKTAALKTWATKVAPHLDNLRSLDLNGTVSKFFRGRSVLTLAQVLSARQKGKQKKAREEGKEKVEGGGDEEKAAAGEERGRREDGDVEEGEEEGEGRGGWEKLRFLKVSNNRVEAECLREMGKLTGLEGLSMQAMVGLAGGVEKEAVEVGVKRDPLVTEIPPSSRVPWR